MEDIGKEELEAFLRNMANPVLLQVSGENCAPCEEMDQEIGRRQLPEKTVFAKVVLGNKKEDIEIADLLEVKSVPTVIGFCGAKEVGRTSNPHELDNLIDRTQRCEVNYESSS